VVYCLPDPISRTKNRRKLMNIDEEIFITNSFEETQKLGEKFAKRFFARRPLGEAIIALYGDLGSGKTTFVQGLAEGLGIKRRVISPTFVFIRQYQVYSLREQSSSRNNVIPAKAGIQIPDPNFARLRWARQVGNDKISSRQARTIYFYHIDLYRIENKRHLEGLGIEEIIKNPENIVAIEWAEKMEGLLPRKRIDIRFAYLSESKRRITIKKLT